jgi:hypothetical protein
MAQIYCRAFLDVSLYNLYGGSMKKVCEHKNWRYATSIKYGMVPYCPTCKKKQIPRAFWWVAEEKEEFHKPCRREDL